MPTDEEHLQMLLKRKARALTKAAGLKYTEALRYVRNVEAIKPEIATQPWAKTQEDVDRIVKRLKDDENA